MLGLLLLLGSTNVIYKSLVQRTTNLTVYISYSLVENLARSLTPISTVLSLFMRPIHSLFLCFLDSH